MDERKDPKKYALPVWIAPPAIPDSSLDPGIMIPSTFRPSALVIIGLVIFLGSVMGIVIALTLLHICSG